MSTWFRRSIGHALLALTASTALVAAGAAPVSAAQHDRTVRVTSDSRGFTLSDTVARAGQITFRYRSTVALDAQGSGGSDVALLRLKPGITIGQVISRIQAQGGEQEGPPTPAQLARAAKSTRWLTSNIEIHGGAAIDGRGTATSVVFLRAGRYVLLDIDAVFAASRTGLAPTVRYFTVYGGAPRQPALLPRLAGTIDMTSTDRFAVSATRLAQGSYLIRNPSDTLHFVSFSPVKPGTTNRTIANFVAAISAGRQPASNPYDATRTRVQSGVLSPGKQMVFSSPLLRPGAYNLECYIADATDGMPHFFMGMHKIVYIR